MLVSLDDVDSLLCWSALPASLDMTMLLLVVGRTGSHCFGIWASVYATTKLETLILKM